MNPKKKRLTPADQLPLFLPYDPSNNVTAKIIADSVAPNGVRLVTMEVNFHRFILAELSKHRTLSMSAQSSRAVPVSKFIEMVREEPAMPIHWGKKQKGMQAEHECIEGIYPEKLPRETAWRFAATEATYVAEEFDKAGYHKQIVNRLLEPFMWQKAVITATDWDNFYRLRCHKDAQPEIKLLAERMRTAMDSSRPVHLEVNEWHLPYVPVVRDLATGATYYGPTRDWTLDQARKYSAAKCASISYRTETLSLEKGLEIYDTLVNGELEHSVPLEHQATPIDYGSDGFQAGITHVSVISGDHTLNGMNLDAYSGNLRGWVQNRHLRTKETL